MLENIVGKPAGQLIGDLVNPEVAIYLGTRLGELRKKEPEDIARTGTTRLRSDKS